MSLEKELKEHLEVLQDEIYKITVLQSRLEEFDLYTDSEDIYSLGIIFIKLMQLDRSFIERLLSDEVGRIIISHIETLASHKDLSKICKLIRDPSVNNKTCQEYKEAINEFWIVSIMLQEHINDLCFTVRAKISEYGLGTDSEVSFLKLESLFDGTIDADKLSVIQKRIASRIYGNWEEKEKKGTGTIPAQPELDGPEPPNHFFYAGRVYDFPPIQWKILNYMWDKNKAPINDVIESVWGRDDIKTPTFNQALHKLTNKMSEYKLPYTYNTKSDYLIKTSY